MTTKKRGRQSAADLSLTRPPPGASKLTPPPDLGAEAAAIFRRLVLETSPTHFVASDVFLLAVFCNAAVVERRPRASPT